MTTYSEWAKHQTPERLTASIDMLIASRALGVVNRRLGGPGSPEARRLTQKIKDHYEEHPDG